MIRRLYVTARTVLARPDVQLWVGVGLALVGAERIKRAAMQMMDDLTSLDARIEEKRDQLWRLERIEEEHASDPYPAEADVDPLGRGEQTELCGAEFLEVTPTSRLMFSCLLDKGHQGNHRDRSEGRDWLNGREVGGELVDDLADAEP